MNGEHKVGFHVKSLEDVERFPKILGVNTIENKFDYIARGDNVDMMPFRDGHYELNHEFAKFLSDVVRNNGLQSQVHDSFTRALKKGRFDHFSLALRGDHDKILERFKLYNELNEKYDLCSVVTIHPPSFVIDGKELCSEGEALKAGREFFCRLDDLMIKEGFGYNVGIENQAIPKSFNKTLGYTNEQLKYLLGETSSIGLTVDSGHRLLAPNLSVKEMFSSAPIVNLHFHTNSGVPSRDTYDDDEHRFANEDNLKHFKNYVRAVRRYKIPVICEISELAKQTDEALTDYIQGLQSKLR